MGPAPMIRMVEISVLFGIKSHGPGIGHKKRARVRASLEPRARISRARLVFRLDFAPAKGPPSPINRQFGEQFGTFAVQARVALRAIGLRASIPQAGARHVSRS